MIKLEFNGIPIRAVVSRRLRMPRWFASLAIRRREIAALPVRE